MNVFILSTGRCGSTTFSKACRHIENYTSAHESRSGILGEERLDYPDDHIESDNRLSWFLGRLDDKYGANAFYVHLVRNRDLVVRSFTRRFKGGIINAYRSGIYMGVPDNADPVAVCSDYYDTVNSNIHMFLKDKPGKMLFRLEHAREDFASFWDLVGAEGNLSAALAEFNKGYNASSLFRRHLPLIARMRRLR